MRKQELPKRMLRVDSTSTYVRMNYPEQRRQCAPCVMENNMCCEGNFYRPCKSSEMIHLKPVDTLAWPNLMWLRDRVSEKEWADFIAELDAGNLEGTVQYEPLFCVPLAWPCLPCQACCLFLPLQYEAGQFLKGENGINLAIAKFNRYLFLPRGIVARRQIEWWKLKPDAEEKTKLLFLRLDLVVPGLPITDLAQLPHGLRPGDQEKDIQQLTRDEFLLLKWPMPVTLNCPRLAYPSCIGEPAAYYAGNEPELDDTLLVKRYGKRNAEYAMYAGAVSSEIIQRC